MQTAPDMGMRDGMEPAQLLLRCRLQSELIGHEKPPSVGRADRDSIPWNAGHESERPRSGWHWSGPKSNRSADTPLLLALRILRRNAIRHPANGGTGCALFHSSPLQAAN